MTTPAPANPFVPAGAANGPAIKDLENCLVVIRPRAVREFPTKDYGPKRATVCAVHVVVSPSLLTTPAGGQIQATPATPVDYPEMVIFSGPLQGQLRQQLNEDGQTFILGWIVKGAPIKNGQQPPWVLNCQLTPEHEALGRQWHAQFAATLPPLPPIPTPATAAPVTPPQGYAYPAQTVPGAPYGYQPGPVPPGYPAPNPAVVTGYPPAPYAPAAPGYPPQQPAAAAYQPAPAPAPAYAQAPQQPAPAAPQYAPPPPPQPQYAAAPAAPAGAVPQPQYAPAPVPAAAPAGPPAAGGEPWSPPAGTVPPPPY